MSSSSTSGPVTSGAASTTTSSGARLGDSCATSMSMRSPPPTSSPVPERAAGRAAGSLFRGPSLPRTSCRSRMTSWPRVQPRSRVVPTWSSPAAPRRPPPTTQPALDGRRPRDVGAGTWPPPARPAHPTAARPGPSRQPEARERGPTPGPSTGPRGGRWPGAPPPRRARTGPARDGSAGSRPVGLAGQRGPGASLVGARHRGVTRGRARHGGVPGRRARRGEQRVGARMSDPRPAPRRARHPPGRTPSGGPRSPPAPPA